MSRYLFDGLSIAVGGQNMFVKETDSDSSYYIVLSKSFSNNQSFLPFDGVFTIGAGTGRFAKLRPKDVAAGKGERGTTVFAALSAELSQSANFIVDWNGRNLSAGFAFRIPDSSLSATFSIQDLTSFSGDGPRLAVGLSMPLLSF
ncbi:MAG: hypothetical protein QNJ09_05605 [Paracoccaceae bacterium]|nr:hypothetical protein [Paracoccaceae bacterium]